MGAFQRYTVEAAQTYVDQSALSLSESLSRIEDADVAEATAQLVRGQVLAQAAMGSLQAVNSRRSLLLGLLADTRS